LAAASLPTSSAAVLDDFGMRELTASQAEDLYELITERAGRSRILTSNRNPADWYPLFPDPSSPAHPASRLPAARR
jgi:DNA replication protein DnaC